MSTGNDSAAEGKLGDHRASADDQTAGDRDQTASDRDQTGSDQDQTSSDRDQTSSDEDQRSSDEDQDAADEDRAAGSDKATYERTTAAREDATDDRKTTSGARDETAEHRSDTSGDRDAAAARRDRAAEVRDTNARERDQDIDPHAPHEDILLRAKRDRERAAIDRERAADDRAQAAADREVATRDRNDAIRMRDESERLLRQAATDELTGVRSRAFGLDDVTREFERARRTAAQLTLAFVDVDGLKLVNDAQGHLAGDALLRAVGESLRRNLRGYDVIVRYGGDEFICLLPNLEEHEGDLRFERIAKELTAANGDHSISVGIAQAQPTDTLQDLIARADTRLLERRARRRGRPRT